MSRQNRLETILHANFSSITHLELDDESSGHSRGLETHYRLLIVSEAFDSQSRVQRQRDVMALFKQEFAEGLHSVTMRLLTPNEWEKVQPAFQSPSCAGHKKA